MMMSKSLDYLFNKSVKRANQLKHEYLVLENVLLSLLDDSEVEEVLQEVGADIESLRQELDEFCKDESNFSILSDEEIDELAEGQFADPEIRRLASMEGINYQPELSMSLQRVLQRAAIHIQSSGKQQLKGINLLVAMFHEKESYAVYLLEAQGAERFKVIQNIAHGNDRPITDDETDSEEVAGEFGDERPKKSSNPLEEYTTNLNQMAQNGKIDPLIGRGDEIKRIIQILCRRRKNNPLIVGDSGVGKTALAEGIAWAIERGDAPKVLEGATIYSLDLASLLAGAKYRGDFEARLKSVLKALTELTKSGDKPILFIDELHTVMGAGATGSGSMDASNLLKPSLSNGEIRCIGSTTHEEYRKFIEKDHAFSRRFQKIDLDEPSVEETLEILKGLRPKFEEFHGVKFSDSILETSVKLSNKFITDRKLPDKAIDLIDEAGASIQLLEGEDRIQQICNSHIEDVISLMTKLPRLSIAANEKDQLKDLRKNLRLLIFGQDHAVDQVCDSIFMSRSGLGNDDKPMGCFLFAGPTGVGKTELARQLSINLGINFERYDMSEYMEKHSVAKLIGAPPGYVGHDQGGVLTDAVKKSPHCVLLLDEIEKAHPDIFNILLQVMDHGALTDSHGRTTNFKSVILIMTTNAGAKELDSGVIGIGQERSRGAEKVDQAIKNFFTPEFRNRLDAIVKFSKLPEEVIVKIVDKFLYQMEIKLNEKKVSLEVSDEVKTYLARTGFDPKMGARPIERAIDRMIKRRLSNEILFGELENGGRVVVSFKNEELFFEFFK